MKYVIIYSTHTEKREMVSLLRNPIFLELCALSAVSITTYFPQIVSAQKKSTKEETEN